MLIVAALFLSGCSDPLDLIDLIFGPSAAEVAQRCGVSEAKLRAAKEHVKALTPYAGQELGKCTLIVDDARHVTVALIEEPTKAAP